MKTKTTLTRLAPEKQPSSVTINTAFLQEIKEASEELWRLFRELHHLCAQPLSIHSHPRRAVEMLQRLEDELALYFSLEEYYGYFEDPAIVEPRLSERAGALRAEHQSLYLDICGIIERAERLVDQRRLATFTRHFVLRFGTFYEQFKAHEIREDELVLEAFDDDIGVGD